MAGAARVSSSSPAVQSQIADLADRMEKGFDELKAILRDIEGRTRIIEQRDASYQPVMANLVNEARDKIKQHDDKFVTLDTRIANNESRLTRLVMMYNVFIFIGSAMGLSIIALIWSLITGRAEVMFR